MEDILAIVIVPLTILLAIFVVHYFRYRTAEAHRLDRSTAAAAADAGDLRQQVDLLKERVEVLEAIVTDGKYDLHSKIVNL